MGRLIPLEKKLPSYGMEVESDCHPGSRRKMASSAISEGRLEPEACPEQFTTSLSFVWRNAKTSRKFTMQVERVCHTYGAGFGGGQQFNA
jgi:hypothetical protein